jgi:hypothetical protein
MCRHLNHDVANGLNRPETPHSHDHIPRIAHLPDPYEKKTLRVFRTDVVGTPSPEVFEKGFGFLFFEKCFVDMGLTRIQFSVA